MELEREVLSAPDKGGIRGLTVEEAGRQWAKEYFRRQGGDLSKVVLVMNSKDLWILDLPSITERKLGVRIDELGYLRTLVWKPKTIDKHNGIRTLHNPKQVNYRLLYPLIPDRVEIGYMANIPCRRESACALEPKRSATIEAAIRLQTRVLKKFSDSGSAPETFQADQVINFAEGAVGAVLNQRISLQDLEIQTEAFLRQIGLDQSTAFHKVKIAEMLTNASQKDSLGRKNPLVQRVRIRSAYLAAVRRKVMVGLVAEKFSDNRIQLEYERGITRWALQSAVDELEQKVGGHTGFRTSKNQTELQRQILQMILMEISAEYLAIPRVRPYLIAAISARTALADCQGKVKENNFVQAKISLVNGMETLKKVLGN